MSRKILISVLAVLFLSASSSVWALTSPSITSKVAVIAPTAISMTIVYWPGRTAPDYIIDFSLGSTGVASPGKTSWEIDGDGWASNDANVGFTVICLAPIGTHSFKMSCGTMKHITAAYSIPYESPDGLTDYFGVRVKQDGADILGWGTDTTMRPHSETVGSIAWGVNDTGHEYSVMNLLKIPSNAVAGQYLTTGITPNKHLVLEFI